MTERTYCFDVSESDLDAFVGALLLGTLEAMRAGLWPLDAGIWALGRPGFRNPLEQARVGAHLTTVLLEADELSALAALAGRAAADTRLDEMIAELRRCLRSTETQPWRANVRDQRP